MAARKAAWRVAWRVVAWRVAWRVVAWRVMAWRVEAWRVAWRVMGRPCSMVERQIQEKQEESSKFQCKFEKVQ